jgi:ankyrin repeat protein
VIKPDELNSDDGREVWETLTAAAAGDVPALHRLIGRRPGLARAEFWYTPAIHFAVREGHVDAVRLLLDAGADPEWNGLHDGSLIEMASEYGHAPIARMLEQARDRRGRVVTRQTDHPIHTAAERGDRQGVADLLDADPTLIDRGDRCGASSLHRAVVGGARDVVTALLDRGADVHAFVGAARGLSNGAWRDLQAIDLAIWRVPRPRPDLGIARLLVSRGATYDLTVAAALGDLPAVRQMLDEDGSRIREARPSGVRPLSAAVEFGHDEIVHLLIDRGADPKWEEPMAPHGLAMHAAVQAGNEPIVEFLLAHGADPNAELDSAASPLAFAPTPEIRAVIAAHGGTALPADDDDWLRRVVDDRRPSSRALAFTFACGGGKRDRLDALLRAGVQMPEVVTVCHGYLLAHADMLRTLLAHGISPDLCNWQHQTLLHRVSTGDNVEQAAMLLDAGATLSARDDEYRSTPLAWAARTNAVRMAEFLLSRGAPPNLPDDEPWATPLAWAERRAHPQIASVLRAHGATS